MKTEDLKLRPLPVEEMQEQFRRLRGRPSDPPDASIIIPVNAQADLTLMQTLLADLFRYEGENKLEFVLVINNYLPDAPPPAVEQFRSLGANVVAVPSARRAGEVVILSARACGVQAATAEINLHFDSDVRIPDATALVDWYVQSLKGGWQLAYSRVDFYGLPNKLVTHFRLAVHHSVRWLKRTLLGIPTTRGSNYAIHRSLFLKLYEAGQLSVDLQVGPAAKLAGARSRYSARRNLRVYTSARNQSGRLSRLLPYFLHRLRYNLIAIPTRFHRVDRQSWGGFDRETENRAKRTPPASEGKQP